MFNPTTLLISPYAQTLRDNTFAVMGRVVVFTLIAAICCLSFFSTWGIVAAFSLTSMFSISITFAVLLLMFLWIAVAVGIRVQRSRALSEPVTFMAADYLKDDGFTQYRVAISGEATVLTATMLQVVELFIDRDFSRFQLKDAITIVASIKKAMDIDQIKILGYGPGSVRLGLAMEVHFAERLFYAARAGDLAEYDVSDAKIFEIGEWHVPSGPSPSTVAHPVQQNKSYSRVKRAVDIVASLSVLVLSAPALATVALLIRATSRGPIFFRSTRMGQDCQPIRIYKFRTMIVNADDLVDRLKDRVESNMATFKMANDPRVTRVGRVLRRTSLDELPQLLNVLAGQMSLVGPRPLPYFEAEQIPEELRRKRHSVKPGLTCIWQISGRRNTTFDRWMEMDIDYIDKQSLWLDFKILLLTLRAVFYDRYSAAV
jgi:lipopolysaccharide/colanic/teichoic acid biosynthesis glycosyltransferase